MTVGSFKSFKRGKCSMCEHDMVIGQTVYYVENKGGYFCTMACLQEAYPEEQVTTTNQAAQTTPEAARQSSIEQAHKDNMESARQTRDMIALLVTSVNALQKELAVLVTMWREVRAEDKTWEEKQILKEGKA